MLPLFNLQPTKTELEESAVEYWTHMSEVQQSEEKAVFEAGKSILASL